MSDTSMRDPTGEPDGAFDADEALGFEDTGDELGLGDDADDEAVVDGLYEVLTACMTLRNERVSRGISLADVIQRCGCDPRAIEWVDDGDVGAPLEGLVYYAVALDMIVSVHVHPR